MKFDEFVKSLQFVLLVTFDPVPGGTKFASLNCKKTSRSAGSSLAKARQFWVPRAKRSLPVLSKEPFAKGDQNKLVKDFL